MTKKSTSEYVAVLWEHAQTGPAQERSVPEQQDEARRNFILWRWI